jgi:hypothetical protein
MPGSLWNSTRSYVLVAVSFAALAACSGGGGGGFPGPGNPNPTPTPYVTPTPTSQPCTGNTAAPASGSAVYYLTASCTTANSVAGFTIPGDGHGLLVAASTVDQSVPFTTPSTAFPLQSPPAVGSLEVSITSGETVSALRRKAGIVSRKVDLRSVRSTQPLVARHFAHPRLIASRKLAALLHSSGRGASTLVRKRSILPTTLGSTAGIWTLNTSGNYVQVNSTLEYTGTYGDVWVDNTLLATSAGPLTTTSIQTLGNDYDNAWKAVTPVYGTPDYTSSSAGAQETTNCTGQDETIFIPDPDNRQALFVISSASNGGFGSYFDPANLVYNDIATNPNCLQAESNERSGVYLQYNVGSSADSMTAQLQEEDVALTANDLSHLIEFVGQTITNPSMTGGTFLTTGYFDSPFITEGLGTLAQDLAVRRMYPQLSIDVDGNGQPAQTYLADPPAYSLTAFYGTDPSASAMAACDGCFGEAYLFARYSYDRFGSSYPGALINSGLTGFANLANAFGASTTPQNVIADFAVASAVSGQSYTSDPRFNVTGFTTFGTYTDQFSNTLTLAGPTASGTQNVATNMTYAANLGSFLYVQLGGLPASATVQVTDGTGAFGLEAALSQH